MKKLIFGAVFSLVLFASPAFTQAAGLTSSQVQAILALLSSFGADSTTIANVNVALGGVPTTTNQSFCHNFNNDLTVGNNGSEVEALNKALSSSGIDTNGNSSSFDENNAGDVVSFQAHYGIRQTGYVGPMTRAKLNSLYGCRNGEQSTTWQAAPTIITPSYMNGGVTYTAPTVTSQPITVASQTPTISSISPNQGTAADTVAINGTNFTSGGNPKIEFYASNGTLAGVVFFVSTNYISPQKIVFNPSVMNAATGGSSVTLTPGTYQVDVVTPNGKSNSVPFTLVATTVSAPAISLVNIVPSQGKTVVHGTNLDRLSSLSYKLDNGVHGTLSTVLSNTSTEAVFALDIYLSNSSLNGNLNIGVQGPGGSSNVYFYRAPTIDSFAINGSSQETNGFVYVYNTFNPVITWSSSNASYCIGESYDLVSDVATNDFLGKQVTSGSYTLAVGNTYTNQRKIILRCYNSDGIPTDQKIGIVGGKG